ncbi:MAG: hypothetical protein FWD50_01130, partial [Betaproteobacteria bacterium]|nr:hypothetical protein [Betaproteobacteria bacterium]
PADLGEALMHDLHSITSFERAAALEVVKWCAAVPKLPADSPRSCHYVAGWDVPAKIAAAKTSPALDDKFDNRFDEIMADCPPIDPDWLRFVPAALDYHRRYWHALKNRLPIPDTPISSEGCVDDAKSAYLHERSKKFMDMRQTPRAPRRTVGRTIDTADFGPAANDDGFSGLPGRSKRE